MAIFSEEDQAPETERETPSVEPAEVVEEKPFLEHIEDLRWVVIKSLIAVVIGATVGCFQARWIVHILRRPLDQALAARAVDPNRFLVTLGVTDPLNSMLEIGIFSGVLLVMPFILYFIAEFVLPALTQRERRMIVPAFAIGGLLFISGVLFCYFMVLPQTIVFFLEFNEWFGWQASWTIQNYIDFCLQMLIAFGVSFELPLVVLILAKLGLVTQAFLREHRRHAIVLLLIFAACVTPTSDPYNLAMLFVPMYLLFELSTLAAGWVERREKEDALIERDY